MNWKTIVAIIGVCLAVAAVAAGVAAVLAGALDGKKEEGRYIECSCEPDAL